MKKKTLMPDSRRNSNAQSDPEKLHMIRKKVKETNMKNKLYCQTPLCEKTKGYDFSQNLTTLVRNK